MAKPDKVKVILVGDSGVGKSSLTHLISQNEILSRPGWTVGCSVDVKLHEYKEGTPSQSTYFIELWDIGGSLSHKNARNVFYTQINGIILVHELTNRKSHENLRSWLIEIINNDGKDTFKNNEYDFDPEEFLGCMKIPIIVIGTKLDLLDEKRRSKNSFKVGSIAEHCCAEEIWLNTLDPRSLAAGTTDAIKLARFFDKVIEKKFYSREYGEKRRLLTSLSVDKSK